MADPGPILRTFATDRALGEEFHVDAVIAVVDAVTGPASLDQFAEARAQAILADRLVLSKIDLAGQAAIDRLHERLTALNPHAEIIEARLGALDPRCFLVTSHSGNREFLAEAAHSDGISSFVLKETVPLIWDTFSRFVDTLIGLRGPDLLRVKGLLDVGADGPLVLNGVQHVVHPPEHLPEWPDEDRRSRLVFIGRGIDADAMEKSLQAFNAAARPSGNSQQVRA